MRKVIVAVFLMSLTGCMSFTPSPFQRGSVVLAGDAEGVESLMDGINGLVANGATQDPLGNSAHWEHRRHQEDQRTRRACANCGIYNKLTTPQMEK